MLLCMTFSFGIIIEMQEMIIILIPSCINSSIVDNRYWLHIFCCSKDELNLLMELSSKSTSIKIIMPIGVGLKQMYYMDNNGDGPP